MMIAVQQSIRFTAAMPLGAAPLADEMSKRPARA